MRKTKVLLVVFCFMFIALPLTAVELEQNLAGSHDLPAYNKKVHWDTTNQRATDFVMIDHDESDVVIIDWSHDKKHTGDSWGGVVEVDLGNNEYTGLIFIGHPTQECHFFGMWKRMRRQEPILSQAPQPQRGLRSLFITTMQM